MADGHDHVDARDEQARPGRGALLGFEIGHRPTGDVLGGREGGFARGRVHGAYGLDGSPDAALLEADPARPGRGALGGDLQRTAADFVFAAQLGQLFRAAIAQSPEFLAAGRERRLDETEERPAERFASDQAAERRQEEQAKIRLGSRPAGERVHPVDQARDHRRSGDEIERPGAAPAHVPAHVEKVEAADREADGHRKQERPTPEVHRRRRRRPAPPGQGGRHQGRQRKACRQDETRPGAIRGRSGFAQFEATRGKHHEPRRDREPEQQVNERGPENRGAAQGEERDDAQQARDRVGGGVEPRRVADEAGPGGEDHADLGHCSGGHHQGRDRRRAEQDRRLATPRSDHHHPHGGVENRQGHGGAGARVAQQEQRQDHEPPSDQCRRGDAAGAAQGRVVQQFEFDHALLAAPHDPRRDLGAGQRLHPGDFSRSRQRPALAIAARHPAHAIEELKGTRRGGKRHDVAAG